jgi:hypothetical protein
MYPRSSGGCKEAVRQRDTILAPINSKERFSVMASDAVMCVSMIESIYAIVYEILGYIQQPCYLNPMPSRSASLSWAYSKRSSLLLFSSNPHFGNLLSLLLAHACPTYPAPSTSDPIASNTIMDLESRWTSLALHPALLIERYVLSARMPTS